MRKLTIEDFLNSDVNKLREFELEVPALGGVLIIREMTAEAKDNYEQSLLEMKGDGTLTRNLENARAKLIAACVYGPDGKRMFRTADHVKVLGGLPASVVEPIFAKCQEMNIISQSDLEELAGN